MSAYRVDCRPTATSEFKKSFGEQRAPPSLAHALAAQRGREAQDTQRGPCDASPAASPTPKTARAGSGARKRFDPLGPTKNQQRYEKETMKNHMLNEQGLSHGNPAARYRRAKKAVMVREASRVIELDEKRDSIIERNEHGLVNAEMAAARRWSICYLYKLFGEPPEHTWGGRATRTQTTRTTRASSSAIHPSSAVGAIPTGSPTSETRLTFTCLSVQRTREMTRGGSTWARRRR